MAVWINKAVIVAVAAAATALTGCTFQRAGSSPARASAAAELNERSTHRLSRLPEHAAACIAERARSAGFTPDVVPLYGLEAVAVTLKAESTGDVLAVVSLTRREAGASALVTTWAGAVKDRADFITRLVDGC